MPKRNKLIFLIILTLAIIISAGLVLKAALNRSHQSKSFVNTMLASPNFHVLKPADNPTVTLAPLKGDHAFSFDDKIAGIAVTVNQQPLPSDFKANPAQALADFAKTLQTTTKFGAGSVTAYTGKTARGEQTTVFVKNDLLLFITSKQSLSNDQLANYINLLR